MNVIKPILFLLLLTTTLTQNNLQLDLDKDQMLRIQRLIDLTQQYELKATQTFQPYADLKNNFQLSFSQNIIITIRISLILSTVCQMKLRVMIDGVEYKPFRRQLAQTKFIVFLANEYVWLSKGKHIIQLQYIKTGVDELIQNNRINMALFKLDYLINPVPKIQKTQLRESMYPLSIGITSVFQSYPQLDMTLNLDRKQQVDIRYKCMVVFDKGNPYFLVTRLMINGKQYPQFRYHTGFVFLATNFGEGIVELQAGKHLISVEYRSNGIVTNNEKYDWNNNELRLRYI